MRKREQLIEYVPPEPEKVRDFARSLCDQLADQMQDERFCEPHVIGGLANFLELATQVKAKHLNAQQLIDKEDK